MIKTFAADFEQALKEIKPHDHFSLIYDNRDDQYSVIIPFILEGIKRGDKCIYIYHQSSLEDLINRFSQQGIDIDDSLRSNQLVLLDREKTPLSRKGFRPDSAFKYLVSLSKQSRSSGFNALRLAEEMPIVKSESEDMAELLAYEAVLKKFYQESLASGICQYDRHQFSPDVILNVIKTHPFIIFQRDICANPFYVPPDCYDPTSQPDREVESLLLGLKDLKVWENELVTTIRSLRYLVEINRVISGTMDMDKVINEVLSHIIQHLNAHAAAVLIYDAGTEDLHYHTARGFFDHYDMEAIQKKATQSLIPWPGVQIKPIILSHQDEILKAPSHVMSFSDETWQTYHATLLIAKDEVQGILELFLPQSINESESWRSYVEALVSQLAIAINNARDFQNLQEKIFELTMAYDVTMARFAKSLDNRENRISRNTQRVGEMTEKLALAMGASDDALVHIRRGVLLQDISKLSLPDKILQKPGPLTDSEWEVMHEHPQMVFDLLEDIKLLRPALEIPYCHHEHWDGSGYPRGLAGEDIPLAARQFAVVNVYNALLTDRPYRPSWDEIDALAYIRSLSGTQFDPNVVDAFLRMLDRSG